jgi:hypothetical protein
VEPQDGTVPAPRRAGLPLWRRSAARAARPELEDDASRSPELSALLGDIDALRLTLQTDLTLAAAALEAGADDLAGELVAGDLSQVRAFAARAGVHLDHLAALDDREPEVAAEAPVVPLRRRRRMLPAAPLVAAAALMGFFVGVVPERTESAPGPATMTSAALAGYELRRLSDEGAPPEALRAAAEELNDELAVLIAQAAGDPAAAQQAMMLLQTTTDVLSRQGDSGLLRGVMAETQALRKKLQAALPTVQLPGRPVRLPARPPLVSVPRPVSQPEQRRSTEPEPEPAKAQSSPAPAPKRSPTATTPSPSPSPSPSSSPSSSPSAQPSEEPDDNGPLPPTGPGLPGL